MTQSNKLNYIITLK